MSLIIKGGFLKCSEAMSAKGVPYYTVKVDGVDKNDANVFTFISDEALDKAAIEAGVEIHMNNYEGRISYRYAGSLDPFADDKPKG